MAIAAHLDEATTPPVGKTREPRRKLRLEAQGLTGSGAATNVLVHNISATGLLLESPLPLEIGETIEIELPEAGATSARVIWTSDKLFGCQFDEPIASAALSAAQLRSAVDTEVDVAEREEALPEESFGLRLQRLRKRQGLTLARVAAELGVSKPTVWAWEQGKARPVESRIDALARVLDVPRSELLSGRDAPVLRDLLTRCREQIAGAVGIGPEKVRILVEL